MNGVINIFKPRGMTSHDVVGILRKILNTKKIGHTGTLDPNVSGVLPLCVGKATRIAEYLLDSDKEYIGELRLGYGTDSQDMDGKVVLSSEKSVSNEDIISVMGKFQGDILQVPPMYSAVKHKGKKLYELAREGIQVERPPRRARIYHLDILEIGQDRTVLFKANCSKGTYIRTLCHDIGLELGSYAYMSFLIRTQTGSFKLADSYSLDYLRSLSKDQIQDLLVPMDKAIDHIDKIHLEEDLYFKISNGLLINMEDTSYDTNRLYRIYCGHTFMGMGKIIYKDKIRYLKMDKVLLI